MNPTDLMFSRGEVSGLIASRNPAGTWVLDAVLESGSSVRVVLSNRDYFRDLNEVALFVEVNGFSVFQVIM